MSTMSFQVVLNYVELLCININIDVITNFPFFGEEGGRRRGPPNFANLISF